MLHLPLRYEDHTRLTPLAFVQPGLAVQSEGVVVTPTSSTGRGASSSDLIADPDDRDAQLVLRFFTFYPSQQKALQPGQRVRVFGDVRPGYFGLEIVHPQWKVSRRGRAAARPADAGLSDDGRALAGHVAQARRANAGRRRRR